jgi:hypothetical protein
MKRLFITMALAALFAGCATEDPYANRGSSSAPAGVQSGTAQPRPKQETEQQMERPYGGMPTTAPGDPRGGIGADISRGYVP